jgi:hypothetical protein
MKNRLTFDDVNLINNSNNKINIKKRKSTISTNILILATRIITENSFNQNNLKITN